MARKSAPVNLYRTSFGNVQTLSPETLNSFAWEPDGLGCYDFQKRTLEIVEGVSPTDLLTRGFFRDRIIPPLNWRTPRLRVATSSSSLPERGKLTPFQGMTFGSFVSSSVVGMVMRYRTAPLESSKS